MIDNNHRLLTVCISHLGQVYTEKFAPIHSEHWNISFVSFLWWKFDPCKLAWGHIVVFHFTSNVVPQSGNKKLNLSFVSLICLETTIDMSNGKFGENDEKDWIEISCGPICFGIIHSQPSSQNFITSCQR